MGKGMDWMNKKIKGFVWKKISKQFEQRTGEELPIMLEDLEKIVDQTKKNDIQFQLQYHLVRALFIDKFGIDALQQYEAYALAEVNHDYKEIETVIAQIFQTFMIIKGLEELENATGSGSNFTGIE